MNDGPRFISFPFHPTLPWSLVTCGWLIFSLHLNEPMDHRPLDHIHYQLTLELNFILSLALWKSYLTLSFASQSASVIFHSWPCQFSLNQYFLFWWNVYACVCFLYVMLTTKDVRIRYIFLPWKFCPMIMTHTQVISVNNEVLIDGIPQVDRKTKASFIM